jgi:hypothetical protein
MIHGCPKHISCAIPYMSVECRVAVEVQGGELRNTDNFLFGRWENYVNVSLLEPTMPITTPCPIYNPPFAFIPSTSLLSTLGGYTPCHFPSSMSVVMSSLLFGLLCMMPPGLLLTAQRWQMADCSCGHVLVNHDGNENDDALLISPKISRSGSRSKEISSSGQPFRLFSPLRPRGKCNKRRESSRSGSTSKPPHRSVYIPDSLWE